MVPVPGPFDAAVDVIDAPNAPALGTPAPRASEPSLGNIERGIEAELLGGDPRDRRSERGPNDTARLESGPE
jgi:hypothetical protein